MKRALALMALATVIAGCGGNSASSTKSPSAIATSSATTSSPTAGPSSSPVPSPAPSPVPLTGAFAVLATVPSSDTYNVSIVAPDGKVVGSAQPSSPTAVTCGDAAAALVPIPISTSGDRAYYMDAQGVVRFMTVQGETGRATTVPTGGGRRSMFAVSPDDQRIAVVVSDFTASGVALKIYVEDLNGGTNHVDIYSTTSVYSLWPIGWHGITNLVLALVPACTQGGGPLCCGPRELHVVDPATAVRRFTIGGPQCLIAGSPSPAGVVCEESASFAHASVLDWTATNLRSFSIPGPEAAYISPDGRAIALVSGSSTSVQGGGKTLSMLACGWIDSTHVISGGDVQQQPRIGNIVSGAVVAVAVKGTCAGRLPGGL